MQKRGQKHPRSHEFYQEIGRKGGMAGRGQKDRGFGNPRRGSDGLTGQERAKKWGATVAENQKEDLRNKNEVNDNL